MSEGSRLLTTCRSKPSIFDGNYEGLGNDFLLPPAKRVEDFRLHPIRTVDKFGCAVIPKELDIKNAPASLRLAWAQGFPISNIK